MSDDLVLAGVVLPTDQVESAVRLMKSQLGELVESSKQTSEGIKGIWEGAFAYEGLAKAKEFFSEIISASERAEQAQLKLGAMLHATGMASGQTAAQLKELAEALQGSSLFKSEDIENAEAALMRFRNVQGDTFERAIKLASDYASVTGTDLTSAVTLFGRALEDPERGMARLQRVIGPLTEAEKAHIKTLEEAGDLEGAQAVILDKLANSVGGAAQAMDQGLLGSITHVKHAWEDFLAGLNRPDSDFGKIIKGMASVASSALQSITTPDARGSLNAQLSEITQHLHETGFALGGSSGTYGEALASERGQPDGPDHQIRMKMLQDIVSIMSRLDDLDAKDAQDKKDADKGAADQKKQEAADREATATRNAQTAVDAYVKSIQDQIAGLQGVTQQQKDFNDAMAAAYTDAQKRQVATAFNDYGVASLGARKRSTLTGDITDPSLRLTASAENATDLAPWEGGAGYTGSELANAGGGRDDGMNLDQRLAQAQRQAQQFERQYSAQQAQMLRQQQEMWAKLAEGMSGSFARVFDSVLQGRVRSFQQFTRQILLDWSNMLGQMAARQGGAAIAKSLLGAVGGGGSGGFSSGDAAGLSAMGGDVGSAGDAVAAEFHSGGIVGDDGVGRAILSSIFSGAPRFHGGLAPDEFPAVLQKGEGVFTQAQMAALGNSGGDVHFHVSAMDGRSVADFFANNRHHIAAAIVDTVNGSRGVQRRVTRAP